MNVIQSSKGVMVQRSLTMVGIEVGKSSPEPR